jgi:hypothetical protein
MLFSVSFLFASFSLAPTALSPRHSHPPLLLASLTSKLENHHYINKFSVEIAEIERPDLSGQKKLQRIGSTERICGCFI